MISEVYNIDCMEYMRRLPDKHFDLVIADPPYGDAMGGQKEIRNSRDRFAVYRTGGTWAAKYGKDIKAWDIAPSQDFFTELMRVSKNQIIWGANYFSMPPTRCFIVWEKLTISESFTMAMAEYAWSSFNANSKIFKFAPQGAKDDIRFHPTQKPIALYGWLLKNFAEQGQTIFDPMMGSQSSRIAAYRMGLDYYGCELDSEYFRTGSERFERMCMGVAKKTENYTIVQTKLF